MAFGELLFQLRVERGLTQRQLGRESGIGHTAISETENGRRQPLSSNALDRVCWALDLPPELAQELRRLADSERTTLGLRVAKTTPRHVAELLREITRLSHQLSATHVAALRSSLKELVMK